MNTEKTYCSHISLNFRSLDGKNKFFTGIEYIEGQYPSTITLFK